MCIFLIYNCINCYSSFTRLSVTDNQLSLPTSYWNHSINSSYSCLERLINRLSLNNTESFSFYWIKLFRTYRTFPVNRNPEWINNSSQHLFSNRYRRNSFSSLNRISFFNECLITKQNTT